MNLRSHASDGETGAAPGVLAALKDELTKLEDSVKESNRKLEAKQIEFMKLQDLLQKKELENRQNKELAVRKEQDNVLLRTQNADLESRVVKLKRDLGRTGDLKALLDSYGPEFQAKMSKYKKKPVKESIEELVQYAILTEKKKEQEHARWQNLEKHKKKLDQEILTLKDEIRSLKKNAPKKRASGDIESDGEIENAGSSSVIELSSADSDDDDERVNGVNFRRIDDDILVESPQFKAFKKAPAVRSGLGNRGRGAARLALAPINPPQLRPVLQHFETDA